MGREPEESAARFTGLDRVSGTRPGIHAGLGNGATRRCQPRFTGLLAVKALAGVARSKLALSASCLACIILFSRNMRDCKGKLWRRKRRTR